MANDTGLSISLPETPKTDFVAYRSNYVFILTCNNLHITVIEAILSLSH